MSLASWTSPGTVEKVRAQMRQLSDSLGSLTGSGRSSRTRPLPHSVDAYLDTALTADQPLCGRARIR